VIIHFHRLASALAVLALAGGCAMNQVQAQGGGLFGGGGLASGFTFSDEIVYDEYRIQKHAVIGHYRLMDPNGDRVIRGDFETCMAKLDEIKITKKLPPLPKDVVIVLHGLGAPRSVMNGLCDYLRTNGGFYVINVGYPSTMLTIEDYAQSLESVIRHLQGVENVSFVAHSMGNIVIRKYLKNIEALTPAMQPQVKYQRMVMIAPPNHGAGIADNLGNGQVTAQLAEMFAGEPAKELAPKQGWPALEQQLATPNFPFGIIAGGRGDDTGYLSVIPGDDDSLLSVETTKLAGAADFVQTGGIHQLMPRNEDVQAGTLNFLRHGFFVSEAARHPIVAAEPVAAAAPAATPAANP
jgi:pimeloyl-ACP methyl ester carboxylesterase